ncbi:MAG TPA: hypothetical protein DEA46_04145 [Candidatus Moranbacteria bacterium]|nr:hypothetical protein [Candidatus Moranbacteria bacterium]
MPKTDQLPIYLKLWLLLKYSYKMTGNFPRNHKHTIGQDLLNLGWQCIDLIFIINSADNEKKNGSIKQLSLKFDQLKMRFRMVAETEIISPKQLAHIYENYLYPIGDQIGGWQKWAIEEEAKSINNKTINNDADNI